VVDENVMPILRSLQHNGSISLSEGYYLDPGAPIVFKATTENSTRRDFNNINQEEIADGIIKIVEKVGDIKFEDLYSRIAKYSGFSSVSSNIRVIIESVIKKMVKKHTIKIDEDSVMKV